MTKQDFDSFVEEKSKELEAEQAVDWSKRKDDWLSSLKNLFDRVEQFLQPYVESGKIRVEPGKTQLNEEYLGSYDAENRTIFLGKDRILFKPIGTLMIGCRGRVDLEGPKGSVKIVLTNTGIDRLEISEGSAGEHVEEGDLPSNESVWKLASAPPRVRLIELTEESLFDALMEVANA